MPNWVKNIVKVSEDTMKKIEENYLTDGELDFDKIIPMPKTLELTDGSITFDAIYYAYIKKDLETQEKIKKILIEGSNIGYKDYWQELETYIKLGRFKNIEKINKEYSPSKVEESLNIKNLEELGDTYIKNVKKYGFMNWFNWRIKNWGTKWNANDFSHDKTTMIFYTAWSVPIEILEEISENFPNENIEVEYADECYSMQNNGKLILRDGEIKSFIELDEDFAKKIWDRELGIDKEVDINI